ncbi:MAG: hypothetical protein MUC68_00540 [Burkholderiaceae bacterium]|nr:hypothetical protein [Burkholderiaceae bacterium]
MSIRDMRAARVIDLRPVVDDEAGARESSARALTESAFAALCVGPVVAPVQPLDGRSGADAG